MKAHVFQHVPFEGPGSIQSWLTMHASRFGFTHFYDDDPLPALADVDLLIVMGGPMSVNDEATLPWLVAEKQFIREAIAAGKAVVGICLGAQLIASALGARVYPGEQKEIGWFDIVSQPVTDGAHDSFALPERTRVFHWHGETFELPAGATLLASSTVCAHQVFQAGARVIGLQCHLETTPESAEAILTHCHDELQAALDGRFVQSEDEIRAEPTATYTAMNLLMNRLLDFVTRDA